METIGDAVQEISSKELFDEESVEKLLGYLVDMGNKGVTITIDGIVSGVLTFANKFIKNRSLCLKALKIIDFCVNNASSKSAITIICQTFYLVFTNSFLLD